MKKIFLIITMVLLATGLFAETKRLAPDTEEYMIFTNVVFHDNSTLEQLYVCSELNEVEKMLDLSIAYWGNPWKGFIPYELPEAFIIGIWTENDTGRRVARITKTVGFALHSYLVSID